MGGKKATSTSTVTIPPEVMARYNAVNARAETAASKPYESFGKTASDYVAPMNEQQALGTSTINRSGGPAYEGIDRYMSPYIKNVADTTGAYLKQQQEQAQSGALGTAASSGAFGGDRAGIAAANLQQQNQMAYGKTMADIMSQGYTQALGASQADLNRGLQAGQMQLAAGTMGQQTEQAGKDAMIQDFMQKKGYDFQTASFLANIAMGTGALSGSTTTSTQPLGFFGNLATGGRVDGYAEGGGVAGPVSHSKEAIGVAGYVPDADLPVRELMVAETPDRQDNSSDIATKVLSMIGGAKNGGAIDARHGYQLGGNPTAAQQTLPEYLESLDLGPRALNAAKELGIRTGAALSVPLGVGVGAASQLGGLAAGAMGYPETGNSMMNFGSNAYDFARDADKDIFSSAEDRRLRSLGRRRMAPESSAAPISDFRPPLNQRQPDISYGEGNVDPGLARAAMRQVSPPINPLGGVDYMANPRAVNPLGGVDAMLYQANAGPNLDRTGAIGVGLPPDALSARPGDFKSQSMARYLDNAPTADQRPMPRPDGLGSADIAADAVTAINNAPAATGVAAPAATGVVSPVSQNAPDYRRQVAKVLGGGKGYTDVEYTDGTRDRVVGNLNVRNNNPGNIEFGKLAQKYGAVGTDGRFAVFPDYQTGRKAQEALLFESGVYSGKTIGSAIAKYAPAGDNNDPAAYANSVAAALGVPVDTPLSALNPEQRSAMLTAMEKVEGGGGPSTYSTTPLDSSGAPVPLQSYNGGLDPSQKPYEERNAIGKFFKNPDGSTNQNAMLSLLSGLGAMASSRSISPFTAILQGLGAGAGTYKDLLKQQADIGLTNQQAGLAQSQSGFTQAQTAKTNIEAQTARFFTVGAGGVPLVVLDGGGTATLAEYLSNPNLRASSNPEVEAAVRAAAEQRSTGGNGVMGLPSVSGYINGEAQKATMNFEGAQASSDVIYNGAEANAQAARSARASLLTQADAISNMVSDDDAIRTGAFANMQMEAIRYANAILRVAGQPEIDGPNDAQIATKMATLASIERASGAGQQSYEALNTILMANPNVALEPETNAKMMANIMLSQQMAVDYAKFLSEYKEDSGNTMQLVNDAPKAFYETYGRKYLAEEQALKTIIYKGSVKPAGAQESPMEFLMNPGYSAFDKNMVAKEFLAANGMNQEMMKALSDENGQIDIARVFGG